jgi:deoxyhypusine monooxygenase
VTQKERGRGRASRVTGGGEGDDGQVRHEAAEALGSIADPRCTALLRKYLTHAEPIVAESCIVALDIMDYEQSGAFSYADVSTAPAVTAC